MDLNFIEEKLGVRAKTSRRMRYEAEAKAIQKQLGGLDEIQSRLGVSGHKLCQLLLIDPSAWSRWSKQGSAPPYVYRALQWFTLLEEKYPGLGPQTFLVDTGGVRAQVHLEKEIELRKQLEVRFEAEMSRVQGEQKAQFENLLKTQRQLKNQVKYLLFSLSLLAVVLIVQGVMLVIN